MPDSVSVTNSTRFSRAFYEAGLDEKWLARIYRDAGQADIAAFTPTGQIVSSKPDHRLRLEAANKVLEVHGAKFQPESKPMQVSVTEIQIINEVRQKDYAELLEEAKRLGITDSDNSSRRKRIP